MEKLKYVEIKEWLKNQAKRPEARKKMPTVREIQRHFGVSLSPVTQALQELEHEGVIVRKHGSGIEAACPGGEIKSCQTLPEAAGSIIFAYSDYPYEGLWRMNHILDQCARQAGLNLINYRSGKNDRFALLPDFIRQCDNLRGIILCTTADRLGNDLLQEFSRFKMPVIFLDNDFDYELPRHLISLSPDMQDRGGVMIRHLLDNGHRRIGVIRNEPLTDSFSKFMQGANAEFKRRAIPDSELSIFSMSINSWDNASCAAQTITRDNLQRIRETGITALAYYSTPGAFAAIQVLAENGLRIPEDISVIAAPDCDFAQYANPAITVLNCDYFRMTLDAFDLATSAADRRLCRSYSHNVIERKSVKNIN